MAWADRQIETIRQPPLILIDLSLAGRRSRAEVADLLAAIPGSADATAVMRCCLAELLQVVQRKPHLAEDVARWLATTANRGELPYADFGGEPFQIADGFALAHLESSGTVEEATARLLAFLEQHATGER